MKLGKNGQCPTVTLKITRKTKLVPSLFFCGRGLEEDPFTFLLLSRNAERSSGANLSGRLMI